MKNLLLAVFFLCAMSVNARPLPPILPPITGTLTVCEGQMTTLSNGTIGGTWSSTNTAVATIDMATGEVTGVGAGTATISYEVGADYAIEVVTVDPAPAAITGSTVICEGSTSALANATAGGAWTSALPGVASIDGSTGLVTAISPGVVVISYTAAGCTRTTLATVNPLPFAGAITGSDTVCVAGTDVLVDVEAGGVWYSSNTIIATVATDGTVTGVSGGTVTISYTVTNSCASASATFAITVNTAPTAAAFTGSLLVCANDTVHLSHVTTGGVWASSDVAIATIGSDDGIVSGIASGTASMSYTLTNSCGSTTVMDVMTVNPVPAAIAGADIVCRTMTTTLTNDSVGGTWSSSNITNASIDATTGVLTGLLAGTSVISYVLPTGCAATVIATVNNTPPGVGGFVTVCQGLTSTLTNATPGGTWSTTDATVTVDGTTGVYSGLTPGTANISYTLASGCYVTRTVTVYTSPDPVTATATSICRLTTVTVSDATPGGTWTSSSPVIASVGATTGVVAGNGVGTARITYRMPGACVSTIVVTVLAAPTVITGTSVVCEGATTSLSNATYGGVWISANTSVAVIVTPSGLVGGISAGTTLVSYALPDGCFKTTTVTVNPIPAVITGPTSVCTGKTIALADATPGGTWMSSGGPVTVGTSGIVTGVTTGTGSVSYRIAATACTRVTDITVDPSPTAITGTAAVCEAGGTTVLSSMPATGTWSSGSSSIATIATTAGYVTGVAPGTTVMTYTLPITGCIATKTVTVNTLPAVISGPAAVCEGSTITLSSSPSSGTWTSSASGTASAGLTSGIVTGISAGSANITYRIATGCIRVMPVTVNALPDPGSVTGATSLCESATITLAPTVSGGTWATTTGAATVSTSGDVTGTGGGPDTVIYSVTGVCGTSIVTYPVTVNPLPAIGTIGGYAHVCVGLTSLLSDPVTGGIWSNSSSPAATVSATGLVTGVSPGTSTISYTRTNLCGSVSATREVTVHALVDPGTLTGGDSICIGDTILLENTVTGGTWSSTAYWIASINGTTHKVIGLFPGTTTIRFIKSNECSTDTAFHDVTVKTQLECETSVSPSAIKTATSIRVYPNPTNGVVTLESPVAGNLSIYSLDGRALQQYSVTTNETTLTLPRNLSAGIYMCRFVGSDGSVATMRLVYEQ
jgi:trimeric autotransporter adhesin